ncbi:hypothetical protein OG909_12155 [Streptomyces sp. NBC_01754]|uniref:hypothetical protein n=1 Tax=Streptomyces sp. NBC_01754 TaxID=2975930 RepID=UPI002DD848B2|nr:hypothetical protein [Streptomyces sp. NBC_01754]WSC92987.1 hypothetical protein OG909_12155 [Streptomyces sp. NBC_01754]
MSTPTHIRGTRPAGAYIDECVADLRAIREQWGDLLAAIARRPAAVWPPLECREWEQPAAAEPDDASSIGRMPLVLREHPAPANLTALDAAMSVEEALFAACDVIAGRVQRPVRYVPARTLTRSGQPSIRSSVDRDDRDDPARWTLPTHSASVTGRAAHPGSRVHGLHWAAVWLEGRALDERHGDLFAATPAPVVEDLAAVARRARATVERALGRDGRPTKLDRPCPWCGGLLTAHTRSGDPSAAAIVCATGEACGAPVPLDRGRRIWRGTDRVGLRLALEAAQQREQPAA